MRPTRFLFVSIEALSSDLAWQTTRAGHATRLYIENPAYREVADGFVEKCADWRRELDWADVVVFDDAMGQGRIAQDLRARGHKVVGGTSWTDRLEDDRGFGQAALRALGIPTIEQADFTSIAEATAHVRARPARYVLKPSGAAQNIKRLLYVGEEEDGSDVLRVLAAYQQRWSDTIGELQLQRRVFGVEVGIGAFFDGRRFLEPVNVNFEHKRLFPGDLGPLTGEMGTTMQWTAPNALYRATIERFAPQLAQHGFVGYFDLNCIANEDGIWPLELTPRFGFPTISVQLEGLETNAAELLGGLARGELERLHARGGYQIGVRLRLPPYPFDDPLMLDTYGREVTIAFRGGAPDGLHIEDTKLVDGQWIATGIESCPLVVTASGATIDEARANVYERVRRVSMPNVYYRNDIGAKWTGDCAQLARWKLIDAPPTAAR